nr:fibrillin-3-like isoform X2 [Lepeophtheirus salmonis]
MQLWSLSILSLFILFYTPRVKSKKCPQSVEIQNGLIKYSYNHLTHDCKGHVLCKKDYFKTKETLSDHQVQIRCSKKESYPNDEEHQERERDNDYGSYYEYNYSDYDVNETSTSAYSTEPYTEMTTLTMDTSQVIPEETTTHVEIQEGVTEESIETTTVLTPEDKERDDYEEGEDTQEEEEDYPSEYENYESDYENEEADAETEILYQNYEILSNFYKLYYVDLRVIDTSCTSHKPPPPEISHGYVAEFITKENILLKGKSYSVILYKCEEGYALSSESTGQLFCQENGWIGIQPTCEIDTSSNATTTTSINSNTSDPNESLLSQCNKDCDHKCEINENGEPKCVCAEGYTILDGETECSDIDECLFDSGGCDHICINKPGSFVCECPPGFAPEGLECVDENECLSNNGHGPCHGECTNNHGSYVCSCVSLPGTILGDDSKSCIANDELCKELNGGCSHTCYSSQGQAFCMCPDDMKLDTDWKNCISNNDPEEKVKEKKTCDSNGFEYDPASDSCIDVDECGVNENICGEHGQCVNLNGSFECQCSDGYILYESNMCQDINECESEQNVCDVNSYCVNLEGSFECRCSKGYILESNVCQDINECEDEFICNHGSICVNFEGSYRCDCSSGYELDENRYCQDIDECLQSDSCNNVNSHCINNPGSYFCECNAGYRNNSGFCDDFDECSDRNGDCSQICINLEGSYRCDCLSGYHTDSVHSNECVDIDECAKGYHTCDQNCVNSLGSYSCSCDWGFEMSHEDPFKCYSLCDRMNCVYECINGTCICPRGYVLSNDNVSCVLEKNNGCSMEGLVDQTHRYFCSEMESSPGFYPVGTICQSLCTPHNYTSVRKMKKECQFDGQWGLSNQTCAKMECPPLLDNFGNVILEPPNCESKPQALQSVCRVSCLPGYKLMGSHIIRCRKDLRWHYPGDKPNCIRSDKQLIKETVSNATIQPDIQCPQDIIEFLHDGRNSAYVEIPRPETNVNWENNVVAEPPIAKSLRLELPPGTHYIRFLAQLQGQREANCNLSINIIDRTPPKVYDCPESFEVKYNPRELKKVFWEEPNFSDNVRIAHMITNKLSGELFQYGRHTIIYEAGDDHGNKIRCMFHFNVIRRKRRKKLKRKKGRWVLCRIGSTGRQIKLLMSNVPKGCRKLPD